MGRIAAVLLLLSCAASGQDLPSDSLLNNSSFDKGTSEKGIREEPMSRETKMTFAIFGSELLADGVATRILYQRHYDEIDPLAKPFTHAGVPGQVGASLLGAGVVGGAWWVLHRTHHERIARNFLRSVTAAEGSNVGRQFSILRTSKQ
jgi:hypothetical protein